MRNFEVIGALLFATATCGPRTTTEVGREVAALQFLIDNAGIGLFEKPPVYCIATDERGTSPSAEIIQTLSGRGAQIVGASECHFDEVAERVLTADGTPAIALWARLARRSEKDDYTPQAVPNVDWKDSAVLVRAGFVRDAIGSAEYLCWETPDPLIEVIQCDVLSVS